MPADLLTAVLEQLADYVIDGEPAALDAACALAGRCDDAAALLAALHGLRGRRGDPQRLMQAEVRLRAALQLPLRPGPPCRAGAP
jgi:hypothetical protein